MPELRARINLAPATPGGDRPKGQLDIVMRPAPVRYTPRAVGRTSEANRSRWPIVSSRVLPEAPTTM